ncbi:hypothetical protein ACTMTJ_25970 [Phytohabitans sp. LJ34]
MRTFRRVEFHDGAAVLPITPQRTKVHRHPHVRVTPKTGTAVDVTL